MAKAAKNKPPKHGAVWHLSATEATLRAMPKYNGYACGHGVHGDKKYNRARMKRLFRAQEGF